LLHRNIETVLHTKSPVIPNREFHVPLKSVIQTAIPRPTKKLSFRTAKREEPAPPSSRANPAQPKYKQREIHNAHATTDAGDDQMPRFSDHQITRSPDHPIP
jgi:ABC-type uncharacterized transport system involved in gliding motility auxiliary subunit